MRLLIAYFLSSLLFFVSIDVNAKILFSSHHVHENWNIYVMDDDGSNVTLLTNEGTVWAPKWSPDGTSVVFTRGGSLWLMNADGTNIRRILDSPQFTNDTFPSFSPDGKYIVFKRSVIRHGRPPDRSVNVLNLKTGKIKEIAEENLIAPRWSPDGKYIVCGGAIDVDGLGSSIWRMNADGGNLRKLIPSQRVGKSILSFSIAKWSPDSRKLVYSRMKYHWRQINHNTEALIREEFRYFICDRNGKTLQRLNIPKDIQPWDIDWMDNGRSLVFSGVKYPINGVPPGLGEYPIAKIYIYHIATGTLTVLMDTDEYDPSAVDWIDDDVLSVSPEGKKPTQWGAIK